MSNTETSTETAPSPIAELFGGILGAILVGTIEDHTQK